MTKLLAFLDFLFCFLSIDLSPVEETNYLLKVHEDITAGSFPGAPLFFML